MKNKFCHLNFRIWYSIVICALLFVIHLSFIVISAFSTESQNFNLKQEIIISSSVSSQSINYTLNPGLLGEPFGGITQSENFSSYSGYNPHAQTYAGGSRYIDIIGTINDANPSSVEANSDTGRRTGVINDNQFIVEDVLIQEGKNEIILTCWDKADNFTTIPLTVYLDSIPPYLPTVELSSITKDNPLIISGTKEENTSLWINGKGEVPWDLNNPDENWTYPLTLSEGKNPLEIYAVDRAGNRSAALNSEILLDAVAGDIQITEPLNEAFVNTNSRTVKGTYNEDSPYIEVNGVEASIDEDTKTFAVNIILREGSNPIQAVLTSLLGNINQDDITIILDTIGPKITSVTPTHLTKCLTGNILNLSLEIYDQFYQELEISVSLDGEVIAEDTVEFQETPQLGSYVIPGDAFGRKTLKFEVLDSAENSDSVESDIFILKKPVLP